MKIKADNAYSFLKHCVALASLCIEDKNYHGLPEFRGKEFYYKFNRLELKAHRLTEAGCNRELTEREAKQLERIEVQGREMIREEYREQFFINGDARGYALKMKQAGKEHHGKEGMKELPEGMYQDWGSYGIVSPEF